MKFRFYVIFGMNFCLFIGGLLGLLWIIYHLLGYDISFYNNLYTLYYRQQREIIQVHSLIIQQMIQGKELMYMLKNNYQFSTLYMFQGNLMLNISQISYGKYIYYTGADVNSQISQYNIDYQPVAQLIGINQKHTNIQEFTMLCENTFALSFQQNYSQLWYDQLMQQCNQNNCSEISDEISADLITITVEDQIQRWTLRYDNCLLQTINTIDLPYIDLSVRSNKNGFIIRNQTYETNISGIYQIEISDLFQIYEENLIISYLSSGIYLSTMLYIFLYDGLTGQRSGYIYFFQPLALNQNLLEQDIQSSAIVYTQNIPYADIDIVYDREFLNQSYFLIQLIIGSLFYFFILAYSWIKSVQAAAEIEKPVKQLVRLLKIDIEQHEQSDIPLEYYQQIYNCKEITLLYSAVIKQINSIKFINNKILFEILDRQIDEDTDLLYRNSKTNDAKALLILSMAKQFYKINDVRTNVGICANNLARVHMRNYRYLEALNEQEQSVLIAYQDLETYKNSKNPRKISTFTNRTYLRKVFQYVDYCKSIFTDNIHIRPRSHSIQKYSNQTEQFFQYKIIMRKYQLGSILYNFSINENRLSFLNESLMIFDEVLAEINLLPQEKFALEYMKINIRSKQAFCFARAGQIKKAISHYESAYFRLERLKENYIHMKNIDPLIESSFVNIFHNIPMQILAEKLNGVSCIIDMLDGKFKQASKKLITMIKSAGKCDPSQQKFAMRQLYHIFNHCKQDTKCLDDFNESNLPKQTNIIYLIDYSKTMTSQQFTLAHSMCLNSLKLIDDNVNIAIYAFNEDLHEILSLQPKSQYSHVLENILKRLLIHPGGQGMVLQAVKKIVSEHIISKQPQERTSIEKRTYNRILKTNNNLIIELPSEKHSLRRGSSQKKLKNISLEQMNFSLKSALISSNHSISEKSDQSSNQNFFDFGEATEIHYICIFSQGMQDYNEEELASLKSLLENTNICLLVFNIANQNVDMLYLRLLASCSAYNRFFSNQNESNKFFKEMRGAEFSKRQYFEFF